jgi:hypothetical protein
MSGDENEAAADDEVAGLVSALEASLTSGMGVLGKRLETDANELDKFDPSNFSNNFCKLSNR